MKTFLLRSTLFIVVVLLLASCAPASPSAQAIQTAIAQTQVAAPATSTSVPTRIPPTNTPAPSFTPEPTSTPVPTATATDIPTPTPDLRVIAESPEKLLCRRETLPGGAGDYIVPAGWKSPHKNEEVIQDHVDPEHARKYIQETGRYDGWWVSYYLAKSDPLLPDEIYCQVIQYRTGEGSNKSLHWDLWGYTLDEMSVDINKTIGDDSLAYYVDYFNGGLEWRKYQVIFQYRNLQGNIQTYQLKKSADVSFAIAVAEALLEDFQKVPLSDPSVLKE